MQVKIKRERISSLHQQMIRNEKDYQKALKNDEEFSVLKGFKNILRDLKFKLEAQ
jgi:bifunctional ADP-heptose synthase (sugar kinase/adenylyltransferase)